MSLAAACLRCVLFITLALPSAAAVAQHKPAVWQMEPSETTADLRGVHAAGGGVVWASGTGGTVLRSEDSGFEWQNCATPPGAEKLDFRAVWGFDDQAAIVMSSGPGALSRLYKTTDGCAHWTPVFTNPEPGGFYDGLLFLNRMQGFLFGDPTRSGPRVAPVEGGDFAFRIRATHDGGKTWAPVVDPVRAVVAGQGLYPLAGESFFAASNSSASVQAPWLWLGTSGSRVLRIALRDAPFISAICAGALDPYSKQCGIPWTRWTSAMAPLVSGTSAGIFSLSFRDASHGVAAGGDYSKPGARQSTAAWTADGGLHWTASATEPGGYRSAVAYDPQLKAWITVGPNGSDISRDGGRTWQPLEHAPANTPNGGEWNALSLPWVVGPHGRIAKLNTAALPPQNSESVMH